MTDSTQHLAVVIPVSAGEAQRAATNSIRAVRAAARQVYACLFAAQAAGADIQWGDETIRVKPDNKRAKAILEAVFKSHPQAQGRAESE